MPLLQTQEGLEVVGHVRISHNHMSQSVFHLFEGSFA